MIYEVLHLKDYFPALGKEGRDPIVTIYLPDNMAEMGRTEWKRPNLVICPGGGYGYCSDREAEPIALNFLPAGFNVFVIRYSCAPHTFPCQLQEVAAVMELIYNNAEKWHCNTEKTAIMGFSAGGHLAAHYSTSYDIPEVRALFPDSKAVQATVLGYPVIGAFKGSHIGSFCNLLGVDWPTEEQVEKFSCENLVTDHTPPAFLWHTAADDGVTVRNTLRYATALAEHHIPMAVRIYTYGQHGMSTVDDQTNGPLADEKRAAADWISDAKTWLKMILDVKLPT